MWCSTNGKIAAAHGFKTRDDIGCSRGRERRAPDAAGTLWCCATATTATATATTATTPAAATAGNEQD